MIEGDDAEGYTRQDVGRGKESRFARRRFQKEEVCAGRCDKVGSATPTFVICPQYTG